MGVSFGSTFFESTGILAECRMDVQLAQESAGLGFYAALGPTDYLGFIASGELTL
jgi:hypothetical protein